MDRPMSMLCTLDTPIDIFDDIVDTTVSKSVEFPVVSRQFALLDGNLPSLTA
jgi:hypothetical protein